MTKPPETHTFHNNPLYRSQLDRERNWVGNPAYQGPDKSKPFAPSNVPYTISLPNQATLCKGLALRSRGVKDFVQGRNLNGTLATQCIQTAETPSIKKRCELSDRTLFIYRLGSDGKQADGTLNDCIKVLKSYRDENYTITCSDGPIYVNWCPSKIGTGQVIQQTFGAIPLAVASAAVPLVKAAQAIKSVVTNGQTLASSASSQKVDFSITAKQTEDTQLIIQPADGGGINPNVIANLIEGKISLQGRTKLTSGKLNQGVKATAGIVKEGLKKGIETGVLS